MKYIYTLLVVVFFSLQAKSQCSDLFFSEYIEGSSNNKAIEIFNPTENPIDLGTYKVNLYTNGSSTPNGSNSIVLPSGTMLASGDVFIIANSSADPIILALADLLGGPANFNGNDAVELIDTVTGNRIDVIGLIGNDPGASGYPVGAGSTTNHTLVRNANTNDGSTDWTAGALTWDVFDSNFFDSLGTHSVNSCDITTPTPIISFASTTASLIESGGASTVRINVINITSNISFEIALDDASTADGLDATVSSLGLISFSSGTADTFVEVTITLLDDSDVEEDETIILNILNASIEANVVNATYTFTILDDDVNSNNPCGNLFFSEYIEGSSSNKALEIYNPTDNAIDLGIYKINLYSNGGVAPGSIFKFPSGFMLAAGDVYVIANAGADSLGIRVKADTTSAVTFFNGDDAVELVDTTTNSSLDIIGVIGEDPGSFWTVGVGSTVNFTLVRKASVHEGLTNWAASTLTWDVYPVDSFTFLGFHEMEPCEPEICNTVTITVTATVTNETSLGEEDGAINASVSGGTGTYTYSWSNGATTEDISDLAPGNYTLTATDGNGCSGSQTFAVAAGPDPCASITITVTATVTNETSLGEEDGAINASVSGGTGTYTYSWSNGATTEDISDLAPGNYTLTATDGNGCSGSQTFAVAAGPDPCASITIAVTGTVTNETSLGEEDGAINASVSGGTGTYTYSWSNGATTEDISDLAPGNYTLTATDGNGCSGSQTFAVAAGPDPCASITIAVTGTVTNETSLGEEDGAINASVSGGTGTYTYSWSNGATTEDISDLAPGNYTLTATDGNGCSGSQTFTVAAGPDPCASVTITVSLAVTNETVVGLEDGAINATISGGTAPYTYSWINGATTEDIDDLSPGEYTLVVTDINGCTGSATAIVEAGSVGVNEINSLNRFSVFPNPVVDVLNIELQFNVTENVRIQIVDVIGRKVFELQKEPVLSKTYSIAPELPIGLYFLKVLVDTSFIVEPFVVQ